MIGVHKAPAPSPWPCLFGLKLICNNDQEATTAHRKLYFGIQTILGILKSFKKEQGCTCLVLLCMSAMFDMRWRFCSLISLYNQVAHCAMNCKLAVVRAISRAAYSVMRD